MGDFILDMRSPDRRCKSGAPLVFCNDQSLESFERKAFSLFLTRNGDPVLWAPFEAPDGILVALAGRPALDEADWQRAEAMREEGGLACKHIHRTYLAGDTRAVSRISGAHAILIHDPAKRESRRATNPYTIFAPPFLSP